MYDQLPSTEKEKRMFWTKIVHGPIIDKEPFVYSSYEQSLH